jgi:transcriptional regulator with XRE-family HTH domain
METETSFGAWVRRRRNTLGLLQKELAHQVGCSVPALQKIERDERRPSRSMAERLAEALGVPADERTLFVQAARGERLVERLSGGPHPMAAKT